MCFIISTNKIILTSEQRDLANSILNDAFKIASSEGYSPCSAISEQISTILHSNHLTFRYILVNALLAKATLSDINILCLQKKSLLPGAYDARSLCHKVLVPFERDYLNGALGRSNEPFLNKPARFPELSLGNAVRRGTDSELLYLLYTTLPTLNTKQDAFSALTDALYYLIAIGKNNDSIYSIEQNSKISPHTVELFMEDLLKESFGGECLALAIGTMMNLLCKSSSHDDVVKVHVVNQSGASSNEISDIDVYRNNKILYTIEAKDKSFSPEDVEHAFSKVAQSGYNKLMFITGPRATLTSGSFDELIEKASSAGVYLTFSNFFAFSRYILSLIDNSVLDNFYEILMQIHKEARLKDETREHVLNIAREYNIID